MSTSTEAVAVPEFDLADRLRKALRVADVGVQEMADYLDVSRNTIGRWVNGHAEPSPAHVKLWALRTGVPYVWLRTGTAPNEPERPDDGLRLPRLDSNQQPSGYTLTLVTTSHRTDDGAEVAA